MRGRRSPTPSSCSILSRLPSPGERRLLDALLIGVADHGSGAPSCAAARLAASGNRSSISSAIAAGILAIGDDHGGAGYELHGAHRRRPGRRARADGAVRRGRRAADGRRGRAGQKRRLPGLGHRVHTTDPRVKVLFDMARAEGVAGDGILFMEALEAEARARIKPLPMNIDGALAAILHDMGFPPPAGRFLFIIGARRRADRRGRGGVRAREADADQVQRWTTTALPASPSEQRMARNDYGGRDRSRPRTGGHARARRWPRSSTTTRPTSIGSVRRSPGPAATRPPRRGWRT